jgi:hypothetical protein
MRTDSKLSTEYRRRLRAAWRRSKRAEGELRRVVLEWIDAGEPMAAIAREMDDLDRKTLWARVQTWKAKDES